MDGAFYEEFKALPSSTQRKQPGIGVEKLAGSRGQTLEDLHALVQAAVLAILGNPVNTTQSLVEAGLDSLGAFHLHIAARLLEIT